MLKLLASAPDDGWAFVRDFDAERIWLVRPPFRGATISPAPSQAVDLAVQRYGFQAEDQMFSDWAALVDHLKRGITRARAARDEAVPGPADLAELLHHAPESALRRFLDRVEGELLPRGEWRPAQNILIRLLNLPAVRGNPQLLQRATEALGRSDALRARQEEEREELLAETYDLQQLFPLVAENYRQSELIARSRDIVERGQVVLVADN